MRHGWPDIEKKVTSRLNNPLEEIPIQSYIEAFAMCFEFIPRNNKRQQSAEPCVLAPGLPDVPSRGQWKKQKRYRRHDDEADSIRRVR